MTHPTRSASFALRSRLPILAGFAAIFVLLPSVPSSGQMANSPARQVTLFGIVADPNNRSIDPKLSKIAPQLRAMLPGHGFKLLEVKSRRLASGQKLLCDFKSDGFAATAQMVEPLDANGKVQLKVGLYQNEGLQFETLVNTPPNQLFFCDKLFNGGARLLIGVGAR